MTKITIDRATVEQALDALRFALHVGFDESSENQIKKCGKAVQQHQAAITALRQALQQPNEFHPDWDQIKPFNDRIAELETAAKQALEALEARGVCMFTDDTVVDDAITALRQALEQDVSLINEGNNGAQQEPVIDKSAAVRIATALGWEPKKEWVGLTDEEVKAIFDSVPTASCQSYDHWRSLVAHAIEAKLKERNT